MKDSDKWRIKKENLLFKFNNKCFYCGVKIDNNSLHIEHCLPKSLGGKDSDDNIVASCKRCNLIKNNKTYNMFILTIQNKIYEYKKLLKYYNKIIKISKNRGI